MQAQANRIETKTISSAQSLAAVQTLLRAGLGCITFMRDLLPQDNFTESHFTTTDDSLANSSSNSTVTFSSPITAKKKNINGFKIMTMSRGYTDEADRILNYLEYGIFDALQKQYLKSFIFAIYLDNKDPNNIVEAYTFNFHYHTIAGTDTVIPIMTLGDDLERMSLHGKDPVAEAVRKGSVPTLKDVKRSVKTLIKTLITSMTQMDVLPKRRFATFKIFYTDDTPSEYEPPHFKAGDYERDKWYFATHGMDEVPDTWSVGKVNAGWHDVEVSVSSIATFLPSSTEHENKAFGGTVRAGLLAPPNLTPAEEVAQRADEVKKQTIDTESRRVVWSAEDGPQANGQTSENNAKSKDPDFVRMPIGIKNDDGEIRTLASMNIEEPEGERHFYGFTQQVPRELKDIQEPFNRTPESGFPATQLVKDPDSDYDVRGSEYEDTWQRMPGRQVRRQISDAFSTGTSLAEESALDTPTPCPTKRGRANEVIPETPPPCSQLSSSSRLSPRPTTRVASVEMKGPDDEAREVETNELMKRLELNRGDAGADDIEDEEMLDLETQVADVISPQVLETQTLDPDPIESFDHPESPASTRKIEVISVPSSPTGPSVSPVVSKAPRVQMTETDEVNCECGITEDDESCACEGGCGKWYHVWCLGYHSVGDRRLPENPVCFDCRVRADPSWELIKVELYSTLIVKFRELACFRRAIKVAENNSSFTPAEFAQAMGCENTQARQLIKRLHTEGFIAEEMTTTDEIGFFQTRAKSTKGKGKAKQPKARRGLQKQKYVFDRKSVRTQEYLDYFDPGPEVENRLLGVPQSRASIKARKAAPLLPPSSLRYLILSPKLKGLGLKRPAEPHAGESCRSTKKVKISITHAVDLAE
ncbi:HORMA domain-containing protein [Rhodocollybia butyracea]|uniref:HORMA domain-containing protein n=1 Tax=Rhodocollybia butyracea TaxID=206335 RepID=A0A9P5P932_9AGAR|nr:HORMA domain-containing protein [Rhodocollybia butyracea]